MTSGSTVIWTQLTPFGQHQSRLRSDNVGQNRPSFIARPDLTAVPLEIWKRLGLKPGTALCAGAGVAVLPPNGTALRGRSAPRPPPNHAVPSLKPRRCHISRGPALKSGRP